MEYDPGSKPGSDNWVAVGEIRSDVKHLLDHSRTQADNMKELRAEIKQDMKGFEMAMQEMSKRIGEVENKQWKWAGFVSAVALFFPIILTLASTLFYGESGK